MCVCIYIYTYYYTYAICRMCLLCGPEPYIPSSALISLQH